MADPMADLLGITPQHDEIYDAVKANVDQVHEMFKTLLDDDTTQMERYLLSCNHALAVQMAVLQVRVQILEQSSGGPFAHLSASLTDRLTALAREEGEFISQWWQARL